MFQNVTYLPPFSNREDYLLTLALFDDDTLNPIDVTGITLANTSIPYTASSWTVIDGNITTFSATQFTIPTLPITGSNNLTTLSITVGTGLAIKTGDPIQIRDTLGQTNLVNGYCVSYASNTGALVVQIGWTFQFEIRRGGYRSVGDGYQVWWDWGIPDDLGPDLSANFGNGYLSLISNNVVQILIPESVVKTLGGTSLFGSRTSPGTFNANMTGTDSVNTRQFLTAHQPIYWGGVTN